VEANCHGKKCLESLGLRHKGWNLALIHIYTHLACTMQKVVLWTMRKLL